jgi:hypothetical protein
MLESIGGIRRLKKILRGEFSFHQAGRSSNMEFKFSVPLLVPFIKLYHIYQLTAHYVDHGTGDTCEFVLRCYMCVKNNYRPFGLCISRVSNAR